MAVEAAIITPLFVLLVFGSVEFGPLFLHDSSVQNAATDGAREASAAGQDPAADFNLLHAIRPALNPVFRSLDYVIVFRATGINDQPPVECVQEAERWSWRTGTEPIRADGGGKLDDAGGNPQPVGVFRAPGGVAITPTDFIWGRNPQAEVACNVYYQKDFTLPSTRFGNVASTQGLPMDYNWPGSQRVDYMSGPQDMLGVYVQMKNPSMTGLLPGRLLRHRTVMQIEARRSNG